MKTDFVFEISWEICNKVGGIYTVLASKARAVQEQYNDNYILIGPDVWKETRANPDFIEDDELLKEWKAQAWEEGLKVRTGRWNIDSKPIVVLVDYTPLFNKKDEIFAKLWEDFKLDSISGQWDYIEPAIFGYAAGEVVASYTKFQSSHKLYAVAHFHEWMTASGILYLNKQSPEVGTAFTTHATVLGRSIAGNGYPLYENLKSYDAEQMAMKFNVRSKNSLEAIAAQVADSFTTVSDITALECKQFFKKTPDVITINGFDENFVPKGKKFRQKKDIARKKAIEIATKLTGKQFDDDAFLIINSGRYEFRNKGIDLYIKALGEINRDKSSTKDIIAFIAVPANHGEVNKVFTSGGESQGVNKYLTHYLWDSNNDPVINQAVNSGLTNSADDKVTLIFLPAYLNGSDGVANLSYYDFFIGFDFSVFPSYYEPWGYTPMESIAFKIPTITTAVAGFGHWIQKHGNVKHNSVTVIDREEGKDDVAVKEIISAIILQIESGNKVETGKETAAILKKLLWSKLVKSYFRAWNHASAKASGRGIDIAPSPVLQTRQVDVSVQKDRPQWKKILIKPVLPPQLKPLKELAYNMWWSWNTEASELFASILPEQWEALEYNPVKLLEQLSAKDHKRLLDDKVFMAKLEHVYATFSAYMAEKDNQDKTSIAYFSMEYGLHVSLKIYSGGLGILAGDYLKQASDSNKNFIALGLLYRYGYFKQKITYGGDQVAESIPQKFTQLPLIPVRNDNGEWVTIKLALPGRSVMAKAWQVNVGRVPLYLLDTDIEENSMEDRSITHHLYGGDWENRLKQEMLLGIGGIRLIEELNQKPEVFHSNEGHSAFIGLERIRNLMELHKLDFETAKEVIRASTLFTTHTPVPAGHDTFEEHIIRAYLSHFTNHLNISWEEFIGLGRFNPNDTNEEFSMSVLAANLSQEINGVSRIHGKVSREMFEKLYPGYYSEELHIGYVTNGVHYYTWTDSLWQEAYEKTFGKEFVFNQSDEKPWQNIYNLPDAEVWNLRQAVKSKMVETVKDKLRTDLTYRQENPKQIIKELASLDKNTLIIGFARRFATYKRAHLLFTNLDRLEKIVNNKERPVIFIFAGKAHPADKAGQDLIKRIIEISRMPQFAGKIIFLENYNMTIGKLLTSGVDVWLNTPTRPLEASGTSGEKAIMNGVLNFSVLDGWWAEGYTPGAGWAIEEAKTYLNQQLQDELDSEIIYNSFETDITEAYYNVNKDGIPEKWISHIKNTIAKITPRFTMQRMIDDYYNQYYRKLNDSRAKISSENFTLAKELRQWKANVLKVWDKISVEKLMIPDADKEPIDFGKYFIAEVELNLAGLDIEDIGVEIIVGNRTNGDISEIRYRLPMKPDKLVNGIARYTIEFPLKRPGVYDYAFRIYPKHKLLAHRMDFPLVKWI